MKKDFSFAWFLIYALYIGFAALAAMGFVSLPLAVFLTAGNFVLSGKHPLASAAINAAGAAAAFFGAHGSAAFILLSLSLLSLCTAAALRHSLGFSRTAAVLSAAFIAVLTAAVCIQVYSQTGALSFEGAVAWISDMFDAISASYGEMISQVYGDSVSDIGSIIGILSSAMINMFTGMTICVSCTAGIIGAAIVHKTAYPKTKLLSSFTLSPVGAAVIIISLAVLVLGSGKATVYASNIYLALAPWFCVSGIRALRDLFRGRVRLTFFAFILVAFTAFTAGVAASLSILGAADAFWRVRKNEK